LQPTVHFVWFQGKARTLRESCIALFNVLSRMQQQGRNKLYVFNLSKQSTDPYFS